MSEKKLRKGIMKKYPYFKYSDVHGSPIRKVYRHLGGQLAIILSKTKITPTQITIVGFLFSLVACGLILNQGYIYSLLAGIVLFISAVLDKADGSLARIKKKGSTFGVWLDSASDNLSIVLLFGCITFNALVKTSDLIYILIGFLAILGFQTSKILFMRFKATFKEANKIIESEKKNRLRSIFHINESFVLNWAIIFMVIYRIEWFLWFFAAYSWIFYLGMLMMLTVKGFKLNRELNEEEELHTK